MAEINDDLIDDLRRLELSLVSQLQDARLTGGASFRFRKPVVSFGKPAGELRLTAAGLARIREFCKRVKNNNNSSQVSSTNDAHDGTKSKDCSNGAGNGQAKTEVAVSSPSLKRLKVAEPTVSTNAEAHSNVIDKTATKHKDSDNGIGGTKIVRGPKISDSLMRKFDLLFSENEDEQRDGVEENILTSNKENNYTSASGNDNLFSLREIQNATEKSTESVGNELNVEFKSLADKPQKRKHKEFPFEVKILNCKLLTYINDHWMAQGRGSLCLTDSSIEPDCSRLVFKSEVNERCLLNAQVWAGMVSERPDEKTVRLTANNSFGENKKYLVKAQPQEITQLHNALIERINNLRKAHRAKVLRWK